LFVRGDGVESSVTSHASVPEPGVSILASGSGRNLKRGLGTRRVVGEAEYIPFGEESVSIIFLPPHLDYDAFPWRNLSPETLRGR
jgi:hypothetical protein